MKRRGGHSNLPGCLNQEDGGIVAAFFASMRAYLIISTLLVIQRRFSVSISRDFKQALELEIAANIGCLKIAEGV